VPTNGKPRPSIQDVARLAGVSLGTVSNVLNSPERVKDSTIAKVTRAIDQLGFVRNDAARQLKAGKSKTIGLIVLDASNPFFGEIARGAEDAAHDLNYSVLLGNSGHDEGRERQYVSLFEEQRVGGVLISPVGQISDVVSNLRVHGTQTVLVDRKADAALCCSVSVDDVAGGRIAVDHLIAQGFKKIAFVGGPLNIQQVADRLLGAKEAVRAGKNGATIKVLKSRNMNVLAGREVGEALLKEKRETWPDAIFAANDLLAVGLVQAFMFKSKVRIPEDIAVIGYDDIDFAEAAVVPLTSVKQPASLLGSTAIEMLIDEIDNPIRHKHRQITFQPELVVRESTAAKN
jgi:LacI family transcriptional regulator